MSKIHRSQLSLHDAIDGNLYIADTDDQYVPSMTLFHGDCLQEMKKIPDGSVDLILTDPPYGTMHNLHEWDVVIPHKEMLDECHRVLRPNGTLILFSQEPYTSFLVQNTKHDLLFGYRYTWYKNSFGFALGAAKAPVSYIEDVNVFFKIDSYPESSPLNTGQKNPLRKYAESVFNFIDKSMSEINTDLGNYTAVHFKDYNGIQFGLPTEETYNRLIDLYNIDTMENFLAYDSLREQHTYFLTTLLHFNKVFNLPAHKNSKSNVLKYDKPTQSLHPTQKPVRLLQDLIQTYTNRKDTVLDFTMGSGSTGVAAKAIDRDFIGIELDNYYFEIASNRINKI